jgi:hypothetical protein
VDRFFEKTPCSRSKALLFAVTCLDQRLRLFVGIFLKLCFSIAFSIAELSQLKCQLNSGFENEFKYGPKAIRQHRPTIGMHLAVAKL